MIFKQLFDIKSSTYTYLISSGKGREALIIDPVIEKIKLSLSMYLIVKNAVIAPTNEPKLNAAWYRGVIILDVFCSIIETPQLF